MTPSDSLGSDFGATPLHLADGRRVTVASLAGGAPLVLYFMRSASCAVCRGHVRKLGEAYGSVRERGGSAVVVVPEGLDEAAALAQSLSPPFPVATGASGAHGTFGLERKLFGAVQQSGTVVVDGRGRAVSVRPATLPTRAFDLSDVLTAINPRPR